MVLLIFLLAMRLQSVPDSVLAGMEQTGQPLEDLAGLPSTGWSVLVHQDPRAGGWGQQVRASGEQAGWFVSLLADHDPREPILLDHTSMTLRWEPDSNLKVVAGDFKVSSGGGFVVGPTRFGGPIGSTGGGLVRGPHLASYAGTRLAFRGLAARLAPPGWSAMVWASGLDHDGEAVRDGYTMFDSGVRRSPLELSRRRGLQVRSLGTAVFVGGPRASAGVTAQIEQIGRMRERVVEWSGGVRIGPGLIQAAVATCACAAGRPSLAIHLRLPTQRSRPFVQLRVRRHGTLVRSARPEATYSSRDAFEEGVTLTARFPLRRGSLLLAQDIARQHAERRVRTRVVLEWAGLYLQADQTIGTARSILPVLSRELMVPQATVTTRGRVRLSLWDQPVWLAEAWLAGEGRGLASALRLATTAKWGPWDLHAGVMYFSRPSGTPLLVVYEAPVRYGFGLATLSGQGSRGHVRLGRSLGGITLQAAISLEHRRPQSAREAGAWTMALSFAISGSGPAGAG